MSATAKLSPREEQIHRLVNDMEPSIATLVGLGEIIQALGTGNGPYSPQGLYALGELIASTARQVEEDWRECHQTLNGR